MSNYLSSQSEEGMTNPTNHIFLPQQQTSAACLCILEEKNPRYDIVQKIL
jgi:hypothetical protein